ncbi:MAG TPA: efflux RND transporter periplasmic adaptor subunit [Anaerolineales bacterium]
MKKILSIGLIVVLVAAGGFLGLRYLQTPKQASAANLSTATVTRGTITAAVSAAGTVRTSQSAQVSWQTGGQVGSVTVKVGDQVTAGQTLAALDPAQLPASILSAQQNLINAKKTLNNLQTSRVSSAQAQQAVLQAQQALDTAKAQASGLTGSTNNSQDTIDQLYAKYLIAQSSVDKAQARYNELAHLADDNIRKAQGLSALASAKQARDTALANYNNAKAAPSTQNIALANANVTVAQAQLESAQATWQQVQNGGVNPDDLAAAQAAVAAAQATLNQVQITAPFTGTITDLQVQPGDLVSSGKYALRIDNLAGIFVDIQVAEVDINNIKLGQTAQLTFDAVPNKTYNGKVANIGQVGASTQGVVNFTVTVQITNPDASIKSGMTAAVNIDIAQHTNVLVVPSRAIRNTGGQRSVTVLFEGQQFSVPVTVGLTSDSQTEVSSDQLKEGDEVVLNATTTTTTGGAAGNRGGPGVFRIFGGGG